MIRTIYISKIYLHVSGTTWKSALASSTNVTEAPMNMYMVMFLKTSLLFHRYHNCMVYLHYELYPKISLHRELFVQTCSRWPVYLKIPLQDYFHAKVFHQILGPTQFPLQRPLHLKIPLQNFLWSVLHYNCSAVQFSLDITVTEVWSVVPSTGHYSDCSMICSMLHWLL